MCAMSTLPKVAEVIQATGRAAVGVSVLGFLIGDRTLIVGDTAGGVTSWQLLRDAHGVFRLRKIYNFTPHAGSRDGLCSIATRQGFYHRRDFGHDAPALRHDRSNAAHRPCRRQEVQGRCLCAKSRWLPSCRRCWTCIGMEPARIPIRRLPWAASSEKSGMKGMTNRSMSGNPPAAPMTSRPSSASHR